MRSFNPSKRKGKTREIKETTVFTLTTFSFLWLLFVCIVLHCSIVHHSEECGVSVCLQGNGQCSPGKENSRILADMSTPNGQTVPRGANSPDGECSINRNILMWSAKWRFTMSLTQCPWYIHTVSDRLLPLIWQYAVFMMWSALTCLLLFLLILLGFLSQNVHGGDCSLQVSPPWTFCLHPLLCLHWLDSNSFGNLKNSFSCPHLPPLAPTKILTIYGSTN